MMSYPVFKVLHLFGVFMVLVSLGGLIVLGAAGELNHSRWRKLAALTNGIGLAVVFIGGFGLLGLLQLGWPWPGWIFSKIFIWLLFGVMMVLAKRAPESVVCEPRLSHLESRLSAPQVKAVQRRYYHSTRPNIIVNFRAMPKHPH